MDIEKANEIFEEIERLARLVENDKELQEIDERYSITAKWIDTDISCCSVN